nr:hypothetical protein [Tanacetum cinerariifolium]
VEDAEGRGAEAAPQMVAAPRVEHGRPQVYLHVAAVLHVAGGFARERVGQCLGAWIVAEVAQRDVQAVKRHSADARRFGPA